MSIVFNKEGIKFGEVITFETIVCYKCAIPFAVPDTYKEHLKSSQEGFYCPNGHRQAYTKSTEAELKEKIARLEREKEKEIDRLKYQVQYKEQQIIRKTKEAIALKSKHTKFKNRVANGVCPFCNRSFENLHNHMKKEHPDFKTQE